MDCFWISKILDLIFLTMTTATTLMGFDTIEINLVVLTDCLKTLSMSELEEIVSNVSNFLSFHQKVNLS